MGKKKIGIHKLYSQDQKKAELELWGNSYSSSRRGFIQKSALASMSLILGAEMVFGNFFPSGLIPALL